AGGGVDREEEAHVVGVGEKDLARGIDRDTAPIEHAIVSRVDERTLLGGWGEDAFVTQPLEDDPARELVERRGAPHVALENVAFRLVRELRERLGRRSAIAPGGALRHRALRRRN